MLGRRRGQKVERNEHGRVDILLKPENPQRMMFHWKTLRIYRSSKEFVGKRNALISEVALFQRPRAGGRRCLYRIVLHESNGEGRSLRQ